MLADFLVRHEKLGVLGRLDQDIGPGDFDGAVNIPNAQIGGGGSGVRLAPHASNSNSSA